MHNIASRDLRHLVQVVVTFALFYKLVSVHSGFDWKSVRNSDQKTSDDDPYRSKHVTLTTINMCRIGWNNVYLHKQTRVTNCKEKSLLFKVTIRHLINKFTAFHGTQKPITVSTIAWAGPWARVLQFIVSHPTSLRSVLISSSHLCLDFKSGFFHACFPHKTLYSSPLTCYMIHPSHSP